MSSESSKQTDKQKRKINHTRSRLSTLANINVLRRQQDGFYFSICWDMFTCGEITVVAGHLIIKEGHP